MNMNELEKNISAFSFGNGIMFSSLVSKKMCTVCYLDNNNLPTVKQINKRELKKYKTKKDKIVDYISIFLMALVSIPFVVKTINSNISSFIILLRFYFMFLFVLTVIPTFVSIFFNLCFNKSCNRFHAAEHMSINAFISLKRVPTIDEISSFSRFSNLCGSTQNMQFKFALIVYFLCTFIPNIYIAILVAIIATILIIYLRKYNVFNFLQYIVTLPPTQKELDVAILCMGNWLENYIKELEEMQKTKEYK